MMSMGETGISKLVSCPTDDRLTVYKNGEVSTEQQIASFLRSRVGIRLCANCVASHLGLVAKGQQVYDAIRRLTMLPRGERLGFGRVMEHCSVCGKSRFVVWAR